MKTFALALALASVIVVTAPTLNAQDRNPDDYERFLIPVHAPAATAGANGSRWQTTIWLRNDGETDLDVFPVAPDCISSSFCYQIARQYPAFRPRETGNHLFPSVRALGVKPAPTGTFLYVERERSANLSMRLAVGDVSRAPAGSTQIPIVPERDFLDTTRSILGAPVEQGTRVSLRIYTADPNPAPQVTVRLYEMAARLVTGNPPVEPPQLLAERSFTFAHDPLQDECGWLHGCDETLRYDPGIVEIHDLQEEFPELRSARSQPFGIRVEIEPVTPGLHYWPLVTATRNSDGFVSVYTVR